MSQITLQGWAFWLFVAGFAWYVFDSTYFGKRRSKKYYEELRNEMVEGIIADLKESDTTLVIDTSKGDALRIRKTPEVDQ